MPLLILTVLLLLSSVEALDLGYGGLPGERTPHTGEGEVVIIIKTTTQQHSRQDNIIISTGSVWPPYPGAGQGYWAARAGFYKTLPAKREKINNLPGQITSTQPETVQSSKSFVYNGNTRYIP